MLSPRCHTLYTLLSTLCVDVSNVGPPLCSSLCKLHFPWALLHETTVHVQYYAPIIVMPHYPTPLPGASGVTIGGLTKKSMSPYRGIWFSFHKWLRYANVRSHGHVQANLRASQIREASMLVLESECNGKADTHSYQSTQLGDYDPKRRQIKIENSF